MEKDIYKKLVEAVDNLPKEAVESADKTVTRKGYDTTGYQYQFLVNVMNEVLGIDGWGFTYTIAKEYQGTWGQQNKPFHEVTVNVEVSIGEAKRQCAGGHKADSYSDALKGAITNGFKKTVALFGVGKKAYEGTLDEDYRSGNDNISYVPKTTQHTTSTQNDSPATHICSKCGSAPRTSKAGNMYCPNGYQGDKKIAGHTIVPKPTKNEIDFGASLDNDIDAINAGL